MHRVIAKIYNLKTTVYLYRYIMDGQLGAMEGSSKLFFWVSNIDNL